jgi:hypothetical protein
MAEGASQLEGASQATATAVHNEAEVVTKGSEALPKLLEMFEKFGFPAGLFPFQYVDEFGFVENLGVWWVHQKASIEHEFVIAKEVVVYKKSMSGKIEKNKIVDLKGWKMKSALNKDLFLSVPFHEVWLDDPPSGLIHFKTYNKKHDATVKSIPIEAFTYGSGS